MPSRPAADKLRDMHRQPGLLMERPGGPALQHSQTGPAWAAGTEGQTAEKADHFSWTTYSQVLTAAAELGAALTAKGVLKGHSCMFYGYADGQHCFVRLWWLHCSPAPVQAQTVRASCAPSR